MLDSDIDHVYIFFLYIGWEFRFWSSDQADLLKDSIIAADEKLEW